jgi:hypothetical protein
MTISGEGSRSGDTPPGRDHHVGDFRSSPSLYRSRTQSLLYVRRPCPTLRLSQERHVLVKTKQTYRPMPDSVTPRPPRTPAILSALCGS